MHSLQGRITECAATHTSIRVSMYPYSSSLSSLEAAPGSWKATGGCTARDGTANHHGPRCSCGDQRGSVAELHKGRKTDSLRGCRLQHVRSSSSNAIPFPRTECWHLFSRSAQVPADPGRPVGRQSHQFSLKRNSKGRRMQVSKTGSSKPVWKSST